MTIRYVGLGGLDANSGLTWALRKLTLNGAEDTPVVAGDTIYVAPGVYRETLTLDVAGTAGNHITYIGDVDGSHTDGVGGIVRITGSDNDQTAARNNCITGVNRNYRTFQGFSLDCNTGANALIYCNAGTNWIIQDCTFSTGASNGFAGVRFGGAAGGHLVQRCYFQIRVNGYGVYFEHSSGYDNSGNVVSNCMFASTYVGIYISRVGGITIKNSTFIGFSIAISIVNALTGGQTETVNNCIFTNCGTALSATIAGEITENYNTFWGNGTDRTNTNTGANSIAYPPLFNPPLLLAGFRFPWFMGELSKWSQVARIAGTGTATDDLFGFTRPATAAKLSWGAIQATGAIRETTTVQAGAASLKLPDAGEKFLMRVPITAVSTVISLYCYREADYAGTLPQMIIRQPGVADRTTTDAGAASGWNQLTDTFTPAALPPYVDIFVRSSNTATATNYDTFFDTVSVS